jgi:hypothetical protein
LELLISGTEDVERSATFWDITPRLVIVYWRFGTTYQSHLQDSWPLKMGPICCPETSLNNYHTAPCNIPEECSSHHLCDGSLKWRLKTENVKCVGHFSSALLIH